MAMKTEKATAKRVKRAPVRSRLVSTPVRLTEDEADALVSERRMAEPGKSICLDALARKYGFKLER